MMRKWVQRQFTQTFVSTTNVMCMNHQISNRAFSTSIIHFGKTDGNKPNPLPKPYELARRKKVALAKKQGRDLNEEIESQRKDVQFPNMYMSLWVPSVLKPTKQVVFHVPMEITKPEIKEILTNFYDLPVVKVNTIILRTKSKPLRKSVGGKVFPAEPAKYFKKAVVFLSEQVDLGLDDNIKKEIEAFANTKLIKKYKEEATRERMRQMQQQQEEFMKQQEAEAQAQKEQQSSTPQIEA